MNKISIRVICTFFLVGQLLSCAEDKECRQDKKVIMTVAFYKRFNPDSISSNKQEKLSIDSLSIKGLDTDSLLYNNTKKANSAELPLRKLKKETVFIFTLNDKTDTVSFHHEVFEDFLSLSCGYVSRFEITNVTSTQNFIDSISIIIPDVNTQKIENIQLYHTVN